VRAFSEPARAHYSARAADVNAFTLAADDREDGVMAALALILLVIGVALLLFGLFIEAAKFLIWVGIVIVVIAIIAWLMKFIRRQA
jgi:fatty-acid desaturase